MEKERNEKVPFMEETSVQGHMPFSSKTKMYGVVSGKGGVGKSFVTSMLAVATSRLGYKTGILDGDLTGPSIPKAFGIEDRILTQKNGKIQPITTATGIDVVSVNLILKDPTEPVLWKGPILSSAIDQFYQETHWESVEYLFIDMPPGTGDVPMKVLKDLPLEGIVLVTTPQDLVTMIIKKAANLAKQLHVPIVGLVENMSFFTCPSCGERHALFGTSHLEEVGKELGVATMARLGLDPKIGALVDKGKVEEVNTEELSPILHKLISK